MGEKLKWGKRQVGLTFSLLSVSLGRNGRRERNDKATISPDFHMNHFKRGITKGAVNDDDL